MWKTNAQVAGNVPLSTPEQSCAASYTNYHHVSQVSTFSYRCFNVNNLGLGDSSALCTVPPAVGSPIDGGGGNVLCNTNTCPSGYTFNSSTGSCTLTDASQAQKPKDNKCVVIRSGNTFVIDPKDPDCASSSLPPNVNIQPNTITATSADGKTTVVVKIDPSTGVSTLEETRARADGSNKSDVLTLAASAPDGSTGVSTITGLKSSVVEGTGVLAGNLSGDGQDFPTDYNRETTQLEISDKLTSIDDSLNPDEDPPDTSFSDAKADYDQKADDHKGVFDDIGAKGQGDEGGLLSWSWFPELPSAAACTDAHVTIGGADRVFTGWCDTISMLRDMMGYVLYVLTAFGLFAIVTGRSFGGGE